MKKKEFALGSLLLGAASWLCLLGLRGIERRMKKKKAAQKNHKIPPRRVLSAGRCFSVRIHALRTFRCKRMRSAIIAMNSLLVGLPFVLETV